MIDDVVPEQMMARALKQLASDRLEMMHRLADERDFALEALRKLYEKTAIYAKIYPDDKELTAYRTEAARLCSYKIARSVLPTHQEG